MLPRINLLTLVNIFGADPKDEIHWTMRRRARSDGGSNSLHLSPLAGNSAAPDALY
jgi:hypothetical protein